jgi:hypothetical protein
MDLSEEIRRLRNCCHSLDRMLDVSYPIDRDELAFVARSIRAWVESIAQLCDCGEKADVEGE